MRRTAGERRGAEGCGAAAMLSVVSTACSCSAFGIVPVGRGDAGYIMSDTALESYGIGMRYIMSGRPHGKGQGQVGDKDAQLLKRSWQRVVDYTEQYAMADEIALFVHTNVDEDDGGGGEVVTPAKIKIHAGPQLPGGVVIAPNTGFETFET